MTGAHRQKHLRGQSAVELAIFGAMVIFVVGLILRVSLSMSHTSNMSLRAFRMALRESYRTADGVYSGRTGPNRFSAGRNTATVLILEDRLSIDPSQKQGTRDRIPFMAQGTGTMTHSYLMKIEPTDLDDLPVYDFFINGQRFPLGTLRLITKNLTTLSSFAVQDIAACNADDYGPGTGTCLVPGSAPQTFRFFRKISRGEEGWCDGITVDPCPNWSADRRFDLNFDGTTDVLAGDWFPFHTPTQNSELVRQHFNWQWLPVTQARLFNLSADTIEDGFKVDVDGDWKEERIVSHPSYNHANCTGGDLCVTVLDDQDGDMDTSIDEGTIEWWEARRARRRAANLPDPGPLRRPGLQPELKQYSFTMNNTYLWNREGRLYSHDGQFIRNETRQDHLDIIERVLYLSNDTGRFCSVGGTGTALCNATTISCLPTGWGNSDYAQKRGLRGMVNPVETCVWEGSDDTCFSSGNITSTCMDLTTRGGPTIFVRSRIRDRRRMRWVTRVAEKGF
jgi:hypothetical protein